MMLALGVTTPSSPPSPIRRRRPRRRRQHSDDASRCRLQVPPEVGPDADGSCTGHEGGRGREGGSMQ